MIRLPVWILMWGLMVAVKLPTMILGWFVIPLLYPYRNTEYEKLPFWTRPWANPEDWQGRGDGTNSLPLWWVNTFGSTFKQFYRYHAIRNPANGLRSFEWFDADIVPEKVEYKTNLYMDRYDVSKIRELELKTVWYVAWIDWRMGFQIVHIWPDLKKDIVLWKWTLAEAGPRHFNIKFGWRIEPNDSRTGLDNMGQHDASFASKILVYRKG